MTTNCFEYFSDLTASEVLNYNKKADEYFIHFANADFEKNKPFGNHLEAAMISYQTGLLLSGAKIGRAQKIMEIGPGAGWLSSMLHRLGNEVFLLETSATALNMAKQLFQEDTRNRIHSIGPHFLTYDGFQFPFDDHSMDRIICFDALHHIPNPGHILAEIYRVLRPGGVAGFSESGADHATRPAIIDCVNKTGILERSTSLFDIQKLAKTSGFSRMTVKAFPLHSDWEIEISEYHLAQEKHKSPVDTQHIYQAQQMGDQSLFFLYKGQFQFDGKYPNKPLTTIRSTQSVIRCKKNSVISLEIHIENTGDTFLNCELHPLGGYAAVGAHLLQDKKLLNYDFFHCLLEKSLSPTQNLSQTIQFNAPEKVGVYQLELDILIEGVKWLQLDGAKTAEISLIVE